MAAFPRGCHSRSGPDRLVRVCPALANGQALCVPDTRWHAIMTVISGSSGRFSARLLLLHNFWREQNFVLFEKLTVYMACGYLIGGILFVYNFVNGYSWNPLSLTIKLLFILFLDKSLILIYSLSMLTLIQEGRSTCSACYPTIK